MDIERRRKYFKGIVSESAITREFVNYEEPKLEVCEEKSVLSNIEPWSDEELQTITFD